MTASARAAYLALMPAEVEWWSRCFKVGIDVPILAQLYESWSSSLDDKVELSHQQQAREPEPKAESGTAAAAVAGAATVSPGGSDILAQSVAAGLLGLSLTERHELTLSLLSPMVRQSASRSVLRSWLHSTRHLARPLGSWLACRSERRDWHSYRLTCHRTWANRRSRTNCARCAEECATLCKPKGPLMLLR